MTAPAPGSACREAFALDPGFLTVNHGSFGATPRAVLAAQDHWRARMEAQPTRFMSRVLPGALRHAAARLAGFLGARADDIVFTENATTAVNAVLRSVPLRPMDEIVVLDHVYGAVGKAVDHVARTAGARVVRARLPFPDPTEAGVLAALAAALTGRTRLAVLDHITSASALVLPVAAMVSLCHAHGVPVLVDGAHAPGQVPLDLTALGADWYTGNCHKWLFAPKGAAFLWAASGRQAGLHPLAISHGYGQGFLAEFDWTGTRDPSAALAVPDGIDFHAALGGEALMARNAALACEATELLAARFGAARGAGDGFMAAMGVVRLPVEASMARAAALREALLDAGTDAPVHVLGDAVWLRLSAQAYNDSADYERLAEVVKKVL
ncbi:Aminotransferase class V-fold PLP-dependent enzyme [Rhodovastum atsumiense]|uniref:Aminotransferase class V-fold PLP-dependent enzyme n=1 Tax=Rhodovastum atsumiense TaxID=504468 RepID=A0A5M6J2H8_9PROT|nr:aminotransferase class V-fold PLP-dependent enzyme [Rhodovastum atsumiense]KAA5614731.1 aminotransferase class V-fold PLP-dependent enzyme [Rhodovastum atsumiense]CAH2599730.1 Aminotransferase class V-fold PLP-dependent enzyme [Rhodovastum atsumiense]